MDDRTGTCITCFTYGEIETSFSVASSLNTNDDKTHVMITPDNLNHIVEDSKELKKC